jgi:hypothetical protein
MKRLSRSFHLMFQPLFLAALLVALAPAMLRAQACPTTCYDASQMCFCAGPCAPSCWWNGSYVWCCTCN